VAYDETGGIPVVAGALGALVTLPGQVQYGDMLMGVSTPAGWLELVGWRDAPDTQVADTLRPQAHGSYPGDVFGESTVVTYTYLLRGTPDAKLLALTAIERNTRIDGVDRPLVVDDGGGASYRLARVTARSIPQGKHFRHAPLECSIQWVCADPRRYSLTEQTGTAELATSSGGLVYPLVYPLEYGTTSGGSVMVAQDGNADAPLQATFVGPLINPVLTSSTGWRLAFDLSLASGETLVVDTGEGTALLDGTTDRLYTVSPTGSPLELCTIPPDGATVSLSAASGSGTCDVATRHAYL